MGEERKPERRKGGGKGEDRSVEGTKGDKEGFSAIINAVKIIIFFFTMLNVEHYHIIRHMQFRIKLYINYALLLFS
jgi:hypothetical protein